MTRMQWALDRGLAVAMVDPSDLGPSAASVVQMGALGVQDVFAARMPLQSFKSTYNPSDMTLKYVLPMYAVGAMLFIVLFLVGLVVIEKDKKLAEGLRMMGMRYSAYYASWFLIYGTIQTFAASVGTAFMLGLNFFPNSNGFFFWLTIELTGLGTISQAFVVTALVKDRQVGQAITCARIAALPTERSHAVVRPSP